MTMFEYESVLIFFAGFFTGYFMRPSIEKAIKHLAAFMA